MTEPWPDPIPPDDPVHPAGTRFCPNCRAPLTDPAECYSCGWWNKDANEDLGRPDAHAAGDQVPVSAARVERPSMKPEGPVDALAPRPFHNEEEQ